MVHSCISILTSYRDALKPSTNKIDTQLELLVSDATAPAQPPPPQQTQALSLSTPRPRLTSASDDLGLDRAPSPQPATATAPAITVSVAVAASAPSGVVVRPRGPNAHDSVMAKKGFDEYAFESADTLIARYPTGLSIVH